VLTLGGIGALPSTELSTGRDAADSSALSLLRAAAANSHPFAALAMAHRHTRGYDGVAEDPEAAAHYLGISADSADVYVGRERSEQEEEEVAAAVAALLRQRRAGSRPWSERE
jgi:hypothetical protein